MQRIEEIPFVAGNPALDFVNTAEERGHPDAGDALATPADLLLWGKRYDLIAGSLRLSGEAEAECERALEVRELLYELFLARVHQQRPRKGDLKRLADFAVGALAAAQLEMDDRGLVRWQWSRSELATVRHVAVTSAVQLLESDPSRRLKQCPGEHCGWFFLDATKRGNRRWCRMSECGQEAKDQRRRERRHASSPR